MTKTNFRTARQRYQAHIAELAALAALTLALTACSAAAEIRDGPAPTTQAQPVVVVVQTPAPARDDFALAIVAFMALVVVGMAALAIGYIAGHARGRASFSTADAMLMLRSQNATPILTADEWRVLQNDRRAVEVWHEQR